MPPVGQLTEAKNVDDIPVPNLIDGPRFREKSRDNLLVRRYRAVENLDGDVAAEDRMTGRVHGPKTAGSELVIDDVLAKNEARGKLIAGVFAG